MLHECHTNAPLITFCYSLTLAIDSGWDPCYYAQVIRWGQVSTYESKTKIYFGVRQNVTIAACCAALARAELYTRNVQTNATANVVANVPQLQKNSKILELSFFSYQRLTK